MKFVLGSGSAYRKIALKEMGYEFDVVTAGIDEKAIRFDDPKQLTLALAHAKAKAIIPELDEPSVLITSDQVVVCQGVIREKPIGASQAREFLESYSHYPAETVTAVVVTNTATNVQAEAVDVAKIFFKPLPAELIDRLVATDYTYRLSGGFAADNPLLVHYIDHYEGTFDSINGLPKDLTERLIHQVQ